MHEKMPWDLDPQLNALQRHALIAFARGGCHAYGRCWFQKLSKCGAKGIPSVLHCREGLE